MGSIDQARAVQVTDVAARLGLKIVRRGFGFCPFHEEKTPSFHFYRRKNGFKCFGCGLSGDGLSLVQQYLSLSFRETLEWFRDQFRIDLDAEDSPNQKRRQALPTHAKPFREMLEPEWAKENRGDFALAESAYQPFRGRVPCYLVERRGLSLETCRAWELGHDASTCRALFPIRDENATLRGVAGRLYAERCLRCASVPLRERRVCPACGYEQPPKYLYTQGFLRDSYLYGEFRLKVEGGSGIGYVVEGPMDVLRLWQYGLRGVVGILGSGVTPPQIRKLTHWFERIVAIGDGDEAGQKMNRFLVETLGPVMPVCVVRLPDGADPDSLSQDQARQIREAPVYGEIRCA